ncbi:MAG: DNA internalization-related competence protein ComEC/Rec2, partial [Bacilli bacterium]|nr:DNA internalization-related competence protein ComEC/Rec2 [Bacilli bacterium]
YLKSMKIYKMMSIDNIEVINKNTNILYKIKNYIINRINTYQNSDYLHTFLLGNKDYIDNDIYESYSTNGISHLLAISGMHVSLLSSILLFILNKIKKSDINYVIVIIFLLFYSFLTDFSPSILRSFLLFTFLFIKRILNLNIKNNYILIFIMLILLIYNPYYIYSLGFKFSFTISFFLITFSNVINKYKNYFVKLFITSLISTISSIPIISTSFYSINLLSVICNMFFVPFVSIILFPLILLSIFIKPLDFLITYLVFILEYVSLFLEKISIMITLPHINVFVMVIYYVLIYLMFKRNVYKVIFVIFLLIHINFNYIISEASIHFIDVGQGDCTLFRVSNNNILIDTGGIYNRELSKNTLIPYFKSLGIRKLDYLIITHGDFDHMGEAINLVNNFKVDKVIFNCGEFNELEKGLISVLDSKGLIYDSCIEEINVDDNKLYFLNSGIYDNENDNSNVIYTEIDNYKFLFMGDASLDVEKDMIKKYSIDNIDVLKVGHHGSKTSSSMEFIDSINPRYSIISVGKNNRYHHPNKEVLDNLRESRVYRTDIDGGIIFNIKEDRLRIEKCLP